MNLFKKQTQKHRKQTCGYQRGKQWGVNKEKQGPTVQRSTIYSIDCNKLMEMKKM